MGKKSTSKSEISLDPRIETASEGALNMSEWAIGRAANLPSTYVGISPERQRALDAIMSTSEMGSDVQRNVLGEYNKTISGDYLDPTSNRWMPEIVNRSVSSAMAAPVSGAMMGGRFGGGAMANAMADAGQETASRLYGANYQAERDRMNQALQLAPQMEKLQYADATRQGFVGQQLEADQAAQQAEAVRQTLWPIERAAAWESLISGNPLMQQTLTEGEQTQPFDWGAAIGGIAGGAILLCHVAAEFFGWFTPDWLAARNWVAEGWKGAEADAFREVYLAHGEEMAQKVREDEDYAATLRPLFEWARDRGRDLAGGT